MLSRLSAVRTVFSLSLLLVLLAGGGCQSWTSLQKERDALYQQNRALQEEKDRIAAENDRLRAAQMAQAPPPAASQSPVLMLDGTGFSGISGVEVDTSVANQVTVRVPGDVLFASGQAALSAGAKKTLDQVANALNQSYAGRTVVVEGHTDSDPIRKSKWASNEALGQARAQAVADYLASRGVNPSRLSTVGIGASQPRGTDKAKNRRVEIVVR